MRRGNEHKQAEAEQQYYKVHWEGEQKNGVGNKTGGKSKVFKKQNIVVYHILFIKKGKKKSTTEEKEQTIAGAIFEVVREDEIQA